MFDFRQRDITDCGAACLACVAAHYRKVFPVARLRQLAGTNQKGSTALGMVPVFIRRVDVYHRKMIHVTQNSGYCYLPPPD